MREFSRSWRAWAFSVLLIHTTGAIAFGVYNPNGHGLASSIECALFASIFAFPFVCPIILFYLGITHVTSRILGYSKIVFFTTAVLLGVICAVLAWETNGLNLGPSYLSGSIMFVMFASIYIFTKQKSQPGGGINSVRSAHSVDTP